MARAPLQVNVILFRKVREGRFQFAVFHRSDNSMWHFVSGGVEEGESQQEAALRELREEAAVSPADGLITLESKASIPRDAYPHITHWPVEVLVLQQSSFAVDARDQSIVLSSEHNEVRWLYYQEAIRLLKWDSDKFAL